LVLNRPLEVQVAQVISGTNPFHDNNLTLRWGGPVGLDRLHVLHTGSGDAGGSQEILEGVNFGGDFQSLLGLPSDEMALRFFLGYAGWDAGQLQGEMELGTWRTHPADTGVVFDTDPATLWHRLMGRLDSDLVWMRHIPRDPSVN